MIRKAAFAGPMSFYPGTADSLRAKLEDCVDAVPTAQPALGVMSPHAGYVYSGAVAGALWSRVQVPDTVVILAPNHHGIGKPFAIWPDGEWESPLGNVAIDQATTDAIMAACPRVEPDPSAHMSEHSAEVQVPFIQHFNPDVQIACIVMAERGLEPLQELGHALADVAQRSDRAILVAASTDMSHFESQARANQLDHMALDQVEAMDEAELWNVVRSNSISMCGVSPTVSMIACAKRLGASQAEIVQYQTSGDVTGDTSQVVGYAAAILT